MNPHVVRMNIFICLLNCYKKSFFKFTCIWSIPKVGDLRIMTKMKKAEVILRFFSNHFRSFAVPCGNRTHIRRLGELCGSVNPCQELICLAFYYQGLFLFSNQILVIWIPFLSRPDKTWKLADSLQLLTSGESSVVTDRYHIPATIPLQAGMINNIQLTRFLLLLYTVIENLSMVFRPRQPI